MSLRFQTKMIVTITLFAAGISSASSYIFYETIRANVWSQTVSRLKDIGRAGQYMLDEGDRDAIVELDRISESKKLPRTDRALQSILPGENVSNLSDSDRQAIEARPDYQALVQTMRRIKAATRSRIIPPGQKIEQKLESGDPPLIRYAYILVPIPESADHSILKFIVDGDDEQQDTNGNGRLDPDEAPTQIGMLYNISAQPAMKRAFTGQVSASEEYYRDSWGVWLSAYIPIVNRDNKTIAVLGIDLSAESEFSLINRLRRILISVVIASVAVAGLLGLIISRVLTAPLTELTGAVARVQSRDFKVRIPIRTNDEFGGLARAFNEMVTEMEHYALHMEEMVIRKTADLRDTLKKVRALKSRQDADYYLTTVLANPLLKDNNRSDVVHTDFLIEHKKKFQYKRWEGELGGDLCFTGNLVFDGDAYTFFFNGDAMGHSFQGAGGALIMGALLNSIFGRSQSNSTSAREWLIATVHELQSVFRGFEGSMYVSCVMGLIKERSGLMLYLNADHPFSVLYRGRTARFLENASMLRKIGMPEQPDFSPIEFELQTGDVIIAGSDGREAMLPDGQTRTEATAPDSARFLKIVERGAGDLTGIREILYSMGDPADDLSLVRVAYREAGPGGRGAPSADSVVDEVEKLIEIGDFGTALSLLEGLEDENFFRHYYAGLCYSRTADSARALVNLR